MRLSGNKRKTAPTIGDPTRLHRLAAQREKERSLWARGGEGRGPWKTFMITFVTVEQWLSTVAVCLGRLEGLLCDVKSGLSPLLFASCTDLSTRPTSRLASGSRKTGEGGIYCKSCRHAAAGQAPRLKTHPDRRTSNRQPVLLSRQQCPPQLLHKPNCVLTPCSHSL